MKGSRLHHSPASSASVPTQDKHVGRSTLWQGRGRWWQFLLVVIINNEPQAVEPQEHGRPALPSKPLPKCLGDLSWHRCVSTDWEGRQPGPTFRSRMLMLSLATVKSGGSCTQIPKFDYFFFLNVYIFYSFTFTFLQMGLLKMFLFSSLTEAGRAGCGFVCTKFLFSRLEMEFSLYPFPLELGLLVSTPNNISWPWSAQSVLRASSSTLYRKTKHWHKPVFLSWLPQVDRYCGTWSLCVSACKKPKHKYFAKVRRLVCAHF